MYLVIAVPKGRGYARMVPTAMLAPVERIGDNYLEKRRWRLSAAGLNRVINPPCHATIQRAANFQPPFEGLPVARIGCGKGLLPRMVCSSQAVLRKMAQGGVEMCALRVLATIVVRRSEPLGPRQMARHPATAAFSGSGKANGHGLRGPFLS